MRLFALLTLLPLLQVASATFGHGHDGGGPKPPAYCGTTTITKEDCKTSTVKAPAVTKTITKDKALCFTTETRDKVATVTSKTTVYETFTHHPCEKTVTKWAPAVTETKFKTVIKATCTPTGRPGHDYGKAKRDGDLEDFEELLEVEDEDEEYITNAERLRRGLPLNKPEKRTFGHHRPGGGNPPKPGPSCIPSTSVVWDKSTKTKTVTPTDWEVTTKCRYTKTIDLPKWTTSTVFKTKTETKTVQGKPTTEKTTITPTYTEVLKTVITSVTGACHPTH